MRILVTGMGGEDQRRTYRAAPEPGPERPAAKRQEREDADPR
jgi:hypothetical protein